MCVPNKLLMPQMKTIGDHCSSSKSVFSISVSLSLSVSVSPSLYCICAHACVCVHIFSGPIVVHTLPMLGWDCHQWHKRPTDIK